MINDIVGISINGSRTYYFNKNKINLSKNDFAIVETEKGLQFGKVVKVVNENSILNIKTPLKNVIRKATEADIMQEEKNKKLALNALEYCKHLVEINKLDIKLIDSVFTFDKEQLIIQFYSENRIDFRNIAKELASKYKTRIELRQVGSRDKAKVVGGIGPCGRPLCCNKFLTCFDTISINMAKNQNISLNPSKINGLCGRLLCCLNYENEAYEEYRKDLPSIGTYITYKQKKYKVVDLDILKRKYTISNDNNEIIELNADDKIK